MGTAKITIKKNISESSCCVLEQLQQAEVTEGSSHFSAFDCTQTKPNPGLELTDL